MGAYRTVKKVESKLVVWMLIRHTCNITPLREHANGLGSLNQNMWKQLSMSSPILSLEVFCCFMRGSSKHRCTCSFIERRCNPQELENARLPKCILHAMCGLQSLCTRLVIFFFKLWWFILILVLHLIEVLQRRFVTQHPVWYILWIQFGEHLCNRDKMETDLRALV